MNDVTLNLSDSILLDFLEKRWARVEMLGDPMDDDKDDSYWQVTPERYNPAYTGEGSRLRDAIRDAIRKNSTDRQGGRDVLQGSPDGETPQAEK